MVVAREAVSEMSERELDDVARVVHEEQFRRMNGAGHACDTAPLPLTSAHPGKAAEAAQSRFTPRYGALAPPLGTVSLDNIDELMRYQPWNELQQEQGTRVREALTAAAKTILREVPHSRFREQALDSLLNIRMNCNAAISFHGRF